ncbi:alcohol dehydrogenase catalytic domain-containing protein [Georgenia yuyongxinii]|uniref:Zinc-binding dehydrogenase n=1 Tax=Georgenia yuyongxinii TaxID=2589797 RepID=A0A552WWB0_9MICO|nr:zinc-binding dehydrogenase [Georgenia yuyongxinii]TRW46593.1 zinc-binding dehydrogenase [Georgenia yuyongxinii]
MRAARIHQHGGPEVLRVDEVPEPEPGPRDVVLRQAGTSVNHRDIWLRKGLSDDTFQIPLPSVLGIDVAGEVVAVGDEVEGFRVGDRALANPYIACGSCHACIRQREHLCADIDISNGAYAEYVVVPENRLVALDASVSDEAASCFANTYITAWEMLVNKARITPDDVVLVWAGTSGLGSAAVDIALLAGATVIATAGQPEKIQTLAALGPDLVLNHYEDDVVARVMEFTGGAGASVVFEHVGHATWGRTIDAAASGARIVNAGLTTGQMLETDAVKMIMKQFTITGSCLGTMAAARGAVRQLNRGRLHPLIGERLPLSEIVEAHRLLDEGRVTGKLLIDVTS